MCNDLFLNNISIAEKAIIARCTNEIEERLISEGTSCKDDEKSCHKNCSGRSDKELLTECKSVRVKPSKKKIGCVIKISNHQ